MNTFFCDIMGTFDGSSSKNRSEDLLKFVRSLLILCKENEIDDLVFRFVTTEDMGTLLPYVQELEKYVKDTPIRLTSQFSEHQRYKNGKIEEIKDKTKIDQITHISAKRGVGRIFIADDSITTQVMLNRILSVVCPDAEIISFVPGLLNNQENMFGSSEKGILGLTDCIELYNESLKEKSHGTK